MDSGPRCKRWFRLQCVLFTGILAGPITTVTAVVDAALCPSLDVVGVRPNGECYYFPGRLFGLLIGEPDSRRSSVLVLWLERVASFYGDSIILGAAVLIAVAVRCIKYGSRTQNKVLECKG